MSHPATHNSAWRLIVTPPMLGADNMAMDEALLRCFQPQTSLPVLRLYGWSPACLSLGRFQQAETVDLHCCRSREIPVVRRITGGGAIYHADELTYSLVCAPRHLPPAASIKDSFRILTGFLLQFYRSLGLKAAYAADLSPDGAGLGERTPFCFAGREAFDVVIRGRKMGGNAQRRLRQVIFQHGSIPLRNRSADGIACMCSARPAWGEDAISLEECDVPLDREGLQASLAYAFQSYFDVKLIRESLSDQEQETMGRLLKKYRSDRWNLAGEEEEA